MADTSNKTSAFGTILEKVKDVAQAARDKVKDLDLFNKVKDVASTTANWIKGKAEAIKNIVSKDEENENQNSADAPDKPAADTPSDGPIESKEDAMKIVGLDLPDGKENVDQAIVNIAQMQFMRESMAGSKDGRSFDTEAVGEKVTQFIDYYGECSELDPGSSDYAKKLAEIDKKYDKSITDAFDKASDSYELYTDLRDKLPDGKVTPDVLETMKKDAASQVKSDDNFADLAYACGDLDIVGYANILKSKGEAQMGVSAEDYADGVSVSEPETENGKDEEPEFETYTNMDLDAVDFGDEAGASSVFMRYAMLKYAKQDAKEGFVDPDVWNAKMGEFGKFVNDLSAIEGGDNYEAKVKELKDKSPEHVVKMFENCEDAVKRFREEREAMHQRRHYPGMTSTDDNKVFDIWSKCQYSDDKPSDPDVSYALGYMEFTDYAKQNGDKTLWLCQSKDEFTSCVNAVRADKAKDVAPEDFAENTTEMEAGSN